MKDYYNFKMQMMMVIMDRANNDKEFSAECIRLGILKELEQDSEVKE